MLHIKFVLVEVDEDDVVDVPFDKDHLEDQIKYGGGHVLTEFIKDQVRHSHVSSLIYYKKLH